MNIVWIDTNVLIDIEKGMAAKATAPVQATAASLEAEVIKLNTVGNYKVMITPAVEAEFVNGATQDQVKKRFILRRMMVGVDSMVHQVPEAHIQEWAKQNAKHGMSVKDARIAAEIKAGAQARGLKPTALIRERGGKLLAWRQRGINAFFFPEQNALESLRPPARPKAPTPPPPPTAPTPTKPSGFKALLKEGLKGAFSLENIASMIPMAVLAIADKFAVRDALRNIQTTFVKEGFAKGVAAGVMSWSEEEVMLNLLNRMTSFRVQGMGDAAGHLKAGDIFKLAEGVENYAVAIGYGYAYPMREDWKRDMRAKGFEALKAYNWYFPDDPAILFEFDFIKKLSWALKSHTDTIITPHIKFK